MRSAFFAILLIATAAPAIAADAPAVHRGAMLRDANKARLGAVDSVKADGSVGIIFESRYVIVPADSLSTVDGKLLTKLTKAQVGDLK